MPKHSKRFAQVKGYYDDRRWTEEMVRNAAKNPKKAPWITEEEAEEILGGDADT